jgi:hypothetical protein
MVAELSFAKQIAGAETIKEELILDSTSTEVFEEEIEEEIEEEVELEKSETPEPAVLVIKENICAIDPGIFIFGSRAIINELAWAGSLESSGNEWLELKNISGENISLAGWQLLNASGQIKVIFGQADVILADSFYLLERTDDQALPGILADKIYTGALKNSGDSLYLFDENCRLQDVVGGAFGWPGGDNDSKRTLERKADFSWQTSESPEGTPKAENSLGYFEFIFPTDVSVLPKEQAHLKILISEIYIEGKNDFVELFNPNSADIDLTDWYLQRKTENAASFSSWASHDLFSGKTIKAKDYFLVANASSSFLAQVTTTNPLTENNTLVLKNPRGDISDKVGWGNAPEAEGSTTTNPQMLSSIGRRWSTTTEAYVDTDNNYDDFEIQILTAGLANENFKIEDSTSSESTTTEDATTTAETHEPELATTTLNDFFATVVINEIAWMGTSASTSADEWIELYNNTAEDIDLANWTLSFGSTTIIFSTSSKVFTTEIKANDFYLLERTDDNTLPEISGDWVGSFGYGLNNNGVKLELTDIDNNLIDSVDCFAGWFAGDNDGKNTMERRNPLVSGNDENNWASSTDFGGTPKTQNSVFGL